MTTRPARGQVLRSRSADRRLRRDGFVVIDLPGLDTEGLHRTYGELHGWSGVGFEADLNNPDFEYRDRVHRVLEAAFEPVIAGLFDGYEPFLYNFLCKWPGDDSDLYLHQDWMFIDERSGARSFVLWVPLGDVTGHNGQLRVLRGSHLLPTRVRGTEVSAPWVELEEVIRPRLESIPVRRGRAVVFNNRLVHCSYPNNSSEPRLVVAVGMRPAASALAHFRAGEDGQVLRYEVDDHFFRRHTPAQLTSEAPLLPSAEGVTVVSDDEFSPTGLAAELDAVRTRPGLVGRASRGLRVARSHQRPGTHR